MTSRTPRAAPSTVAHSSTLPLMSWTPKGLTQRGCALAGVRWSTSLPTLPRPRSMSTLHAVESRSQP